MSGFSKSALIERHGIQNKGNEEWNRLTATTGRYRLQDAEAFAAIRVQAPCMELGQAAGLAAALCLREGKIPVQELNHEKLVRAVRAAGSLV